MKNFLWVLIGVLLMAQPSFATNEHATGYVPNPLRYFRAQWRDYKKHGLMSAVPLPQEYDLRKIGNGTAPVRAQGSCGSCWWFGTKGVMESLVKLRDNKDIEISGQWGIDCSPAAFYGCGGGDFAFEKLKAPYGAIYEPDMGDAYPTKYRASGSSCKTSWLKETPGHFHEQVVDWAFIQNDVEGMQRAMFENEMPLGVTIGAGGMSPGSDGWQESCRSASTNHIVYVVGWLEGSLHGHKSGVYWIVQNSWGTKFGDHGFEYLLARNGNTVCASLGSDEVVAVNYKPSCKPQPKADGGPDQTIFTGSIPMAHSAKIGTTALTSTSYSWSPALGLDDSHVSQPNASPDKTTTYTVTATTPCGAATSQVQVRVFSEINGNRTEIQ